METRLAQRNQSMDVCKFLASLFVIFIHVPFPGRTGQWIACLARFAVPFFFMVSGYFNFGATNRQVLHRISHIGVLYLIGASFGEICSAGCVAFSEGTVLNLSRAIPSGQQLLYLLVFHIPPRTGSLWYLAALVACYLVFAAYVRFFQKRPCCYRAFYRFCLILFFVFFLLDTLCPILDSSMILLLRNGWLLGLPLFGAGLFLRQYQEAVFQLHSFSDSRLCGMLGIGAVISVVQCEFLPYGNIPIGTYFLVAAIFLLTASHPVLPPLPPALTGFLGKLSLWVYLLHLPLLEIFQWFFQYPVMQRLGAREAWYTPWIIAGFSFLLALFFSTCEIFLRRYLLRRRR